MTTCDKCHSKYEGDYCPNPMCGRTFAPRSNNRPLPMDTVKTIKCTHSDYIWSEEAQKNKVERCQTEVTRTIQEHVNNKNKCDFHSPLGEATA